MDSLFHVGLGNAVASAALALIVAGFALLSWRPALVHRLWLLVLLKLVAPPLLLVPFVFARSESPKPARPDLTPLAVEDSGIVNPSGVAGVEGAPGPGLRAATPATPRASNKTLPLAKGELEGVVLDRSEAARNPPRSSLHEGGRRRLLDGPILGERRNSLAHRAVSSWEGVLATIWLAGTASALILTGVRVRQFNRLLRSATPAPAEVQHQARDLADRLGLARCPRVWLVPGCVSPMIWGVGRAPRLLVPGQLWLRLDESQRDALLVHELAHLRRRDHWVRLVELAATTLYWWHPAAWWARRRLREAEEQCCDAWVVWALPGSSRAYATALVEAVDFLSGPRPTTPALASGMGQVQHLTRRLTMIMRAQTQRSLSWPGRLAVLGLGALLLPILPTAAQPPPRVETIEEPATQKTPAPKPAPAAITELPPATPPIATTPAPAAEEKRPGDDDDLESLRARLRYAHDELARMKKLAQAGAVNQSLVEQAGAAVEAAESNLRSARRHDVERHSLARDEVEIAEAALAGKTAQLQEAKARREGASVVLASTKRLREKKMVSSDEVAKAEADSAVFDAQVAAKEAEVREAEVRLRQARRRLGAFDSVATPAVAAPIDQDRRMKDLEAKIDVLLREVQDLRRERRTQPNDGGGDALSTPRLPDPGPSNPPQRDVPEPKTS